MGRGERFIRKAVDFGRAGKNADGNLNTLVLDLNLVPCVSTYVRLARRELVLSALQKTVYFPFR